MEVSETLQAITQIAESVGTVAVLIYGWMKAEKRADKLESELLSDWQRQNDREKDATVIVQP